MFEGIGDTQFIEKFQGRFILNFDNFITLICFGDYKSCLMKRKIIVSIWIKT